jgi:hypothetical protein
MGEAARRKVADRFPVEGFVSGFKRSIQAAEKKWQMRRLSDDYFSLTISGGRTKPLRGRKKDWYVAPFFLLNLVQFGVIVPPLLSFGNL